MSLTQKFVVKNAFSFPRPLLLPLTCDSREGEGG